MSNKNKIQYRQVGYYLIPNLIIPPEEAKITLGKWGMMYKSYLEKHKRVLFSSLLSQGKLYQHCAEIENQARVMFDTLIEQMKEAEGVSQGMPFMFMVDFSKQLLRSIQRMIYCLFTV